MKKIFNNFSLDLVWLWLCLFIVISSLFYFIYQTDIYSLILSLILSYIPVKWYMEKRNKNKKTNHFKFKNLYFFIFLLFWLLSLVILLLSQSDKALISPWQVVPKYFFITYFIMVFSALMLWRKNKQKVYQKIALYLLYFLSFSVAIIVYKIAYGYDPFVHYASINYIIENGFMLPKNLYYIGQYNLIIALNQFFALPVAFLNKIIVPVFAAIFVPFFSYKFLKETLNEKSNIFLTIALTLILGFPLFIVSTPQNLSYIFLLATIVFNLRKQVFPFGVFSSLACFFIHPISGIPAILFTAIYLIKKYIRKEKIKKTFNFFIYTSTIILVPLSLIIGAGANLNFKLKFTSPSLFYLNQENIFLNFLYFFINNYYWFLLVFIIFAFIYIKKTDYFSNIKASLKMALAILIATFLSFFLNWQELINYEQSDYAKRFLIITTLFLLPLIWLFLSFVVEKIKKQDIVKQIIFFIFLGFLITISLYGSYPREDNYHNSRGYSLSKADLEVVDIIDKWTKSDYIVLANQQIGVAALKKKGFDNYLNSSYGPLYFYSIPTGGKLYQFYLQMVYEKASRQTMKKAMEIAQVDYSFFVINKYWWASEKIIKEALLSSDDFLEINNGEIIIFKYIND